MKKNLFLSGLAVCLLLTLVSCLGESSNVSTFTSVGIVRFNEKTGRLAIESPDCSPYYFTPQNTNLADFSIDDCVRFLCTVDLSSAENSADSLEKRKSYMGTLSNIEHVNRYEWSGYMTDTTKLLPNEQKIAYAFEEGGYLFLSGTMFLLSDITMLTDQRNDWILYSDIEAEPETDKNTSYNIYSFFLRSTIKLEGIKPEKNLAILNAYKIDYIWDRIQSREKADSKKAFIMRFNYIKDIKSDSIPVWAQQDLTVEKAQ
ncbi:MAG: hypothetical protein LBH04_06615 [Tannerellaceae bacterium]|jgi:hypothetical protein|nr:hypothetical protein [Tannerellaceae bacterium]